MSDIATRIYEKVCERVPCLTAIECELVLEDIAGFIQPLERDAGRYLKLRNSGLFVVMDEDGDYRTTETLDAALDALASHPPNPLEVGGSDEVLSCG